MIKSFTQGALNPSSVSKKLRCPYAIFQINNILLVIQQNTNNFRQDTLYPPSFRKKLGVLHRKPFSKHPLFSTFSLILTLSEVCNIWNKYWLPKKSAKEVFLHKTTYTLSLFQKDSCALYRPILQKYSLFTTFLLVFTVDEACNISDKYRSPNNLPTH